MFSVWFFRVLLACLFDVVCVAYEAPRVLMCAVCILRVLVGVYISHVLMCVVYIFRVLMCVYV